MVYAIFSQSPGAVILPEHAESFNDWIDVSHEMVQRARGTDPSKPELYDGSYAQVYDHNPADPENYGKAEPIMLLTLTDNATNVKVETF